MENKTDTPLKLIFRTIDLYMGKIHPSVYLNNDINFKFKHGYIYVFCNDVAIIGLKKTRMGVIACKAVQEVGIPIAGILGETSRTISGYLECWIYQRHPEFKNMWKAASLRNPVLDMNYMLNSTDIPDWIFACCGKEEFDFAANTPEKMENFFNRSPMARVRDVVTPAQFLIGDADLRVPPH